MTVKLFEIRDRGTFIPVMAVRLESPDERTRWLLASSGYGTQPEDHRRYVLLFNLVGNQAHYDPYDWGPARTLRDAHRHILDHFEELEPGQVIDVEYLLGETPAPKISEQHERIL